MTSHNRSASSTTVCHNRIGAIMAHTSRYSCNGTSRLAADAGLSKATVSDLIHGNVTPLYTSADKVVKCLSIAMGRRLSHRQVFRSGKAYPTRFVCKLCRYCRDCLPAAIYNDDGSVNVCDWRLRIGRWTGDVTEFGRTNKEVEE